MLLAKRGERRPLEAIEAADKMKAAGYSATDIHAATSAHLEGTPYAGVVHGPASGKAMFEVTDERAELKRFAIKAGPGTSAPLEKVLPNPDLHAIHPEIGQVPVGKSLNESSSVYITPNGDAYIEVGQKVIGPKVAGQTNLLPEAKGRIGHEVQHVASHINKLPVGGTPEDFKGTYEQQKAQYKRLEGEQVAELTRERMNMTAAQRRAQMPTFAEGTILAPEGRKAANRQAMAERGLSDREMAVLKRLVAQGSGTKASTPTDTVRQKLTRATNEQLQALDDHAQAAHRSAKGNARAERIRAWKAAVGDAAKAADAPVKVEDAVKHPGTPIPPKPEISPTSTVKLMGVPADGGKPFVMAILDMAGDKQAQAERIWKDSAHLYTQKLKGYEVHDKAGNSLIGFQNKDTLNAALKAQGKAEAGKAKSPADFTHSEKFRVTPKNPNSGLYELTPEYAKALVREAHAIPKSDPTRSLKIEAAQGKAHVYYDANGKFAGHRGTAALRDPNRPIELHSSTRQSLESTKAGRETLRKLGHPVEEPKSITQLKAEAKAAGIKGTSKMSKSALIEALGKGLNKAGSVAMIAAPVAAAAVAYDATRSEAKAAGASDTDATRKAMTNAAVAGGATAGVMAGVGVAAKFALTRIVPAAVAGPAGWALLGGMTAYGAYRAYQAHKDKGLGGTAAALSLIGADEALHLVKRDAGPTRLNAEQAAAYKAANARHAAMQAQAPASTNKLVGFQNPANLESAMASQNKHWDGVYGKKS